MAGSCPAFVAVQRRCRQPLRWLLACYSYGSMDPWPSARLAAFVLLVSGGAAAQILDVTPSVPPARYWDKPFEPLRPAGKAKYHYGRRTFGPWGLFTTTYAAGIDQWQDDPAEWRQGFDGYGLRVANRIGTRLVRRSVRLGFELLRHEDPRFFRSGRTGFWARTKQVLLMQSLYVKTDDGGQTIAVGRIAGAMAAAQIAQAWQPDSRDGFGHNLRRGGWVLAGDAGARMLREFWPDIKRGLGRIGR